MNNKRKQLYDNLIGTGRVSNAEIGTLDEFRKAIKDEQTARQFHKNLLGAGFTSDEIGSEDDFYNSISSDFDVQGKAQSSNEPYTHVYDKDMNLIGGTAYQAPEPYQYKPEVQQHIVQNIPDMFKPKTGNLVDRPAGISATEEPKFDVTNVGKSFADTVNDAYATSNEMGERMNARIGVLAKNVQDPEFQKGQTKAQLRSISDEVSNALQELQSRVEVSKLDKFRPANLQSLPVNPVNQELMPEYTALRKAQRLVEESQNIIEEASKKGNTNFMAGLTRGFWDNLNAEDYTFGADDAAQSAYLYQALDKAERGEVLTKAEETLLDAAAVNMAVQSYYAQDLGKGYGAGSVTAESIPFMLEMAINPISASGKTTAKMLLKYGLKKFAKNKAAKVGARLAGDALAATGMAATTGFGDVLEGTTDRLAKNYKYQLDSEGRLHVEKKDDTMGIGEAFTRSFATRAIENQSEMIFRAFEPIGGFMKGVQNVLPGGVNRFFDMLSHNKVADAYRWLKNSKVFRNYLVKDIRNATQIGGLGEEYLEEVYNNLANFAIGEMSWEDVTSLDKNIDTLLGLAPTQVMFGILGLGGAGAMRYQTRRTLEDLQATMNEQQRRELEGLLDMGIDAKETDVRGFIRSVMANQNYTIENKRDLIKAAYYVAKQKGIDEMAEADVVEKVNAEYSLIDSMTDPSTGTYAEVNRLVINPETGEREAQPGYVVGWIGEGDKRQPIFVADGMENTYENRMVLKPTEWEKESYQEMPAEQVKTVSEEMIREEATQQAEQEAKYAPEVLNAQMQQGVPFDTPNAQIVPVAPMPEGNGWIVEEYALDTNNKVAKTPIVRELTNDEYRDMLQAQVEAKEAIATPMSPMESQESTPMTPMSTPMTENVQPVAEGVATQPQAPVIPTKEDGSIDFVSYGKEGTFKTLGDKYGEKMPNKVAVTAKALAEDLNKAQNKLQKAEEAYDNAPIGREQKAEEARDKAKQELEAIQREANFWAEMDAEIKDAQARRESMLNPQTEVETSTEPMNVDEFVAQQLASGNIILDEEDYKKETGYGDTEANAMNGGATKLFGKNGMTIQEAGERLMEMDRENGTNFFDQSDPNAGRDALLSVLASVRSRKELNQYIAENRKSQSAKESEGLRNELEKQVVSANYASLEDYALQMEAAEMENPFDGIDVAQIDAIFAEAEEEYQQYLNSLENGQGTTSEAAEGSDNVLPEEQSDNTGGTSGIESEGDSERNGEGTLEESEGTYEEGEDVKSPIRERAKDWENKLGVKVNLIESIDQVTNREALRAIQNGQRVTGWFEESTGEVCFYVPYLESENEVDSTYIHEVVAHKGLRGLLGDKFDAFCDEVWDMMSNADRLKFMAYPGVSHLEGKEKARAAADEYIAHLSENIDVTDSAWNQLTELIKKFLKAIGLEPKMTNADIANTIKRSYQRLLEGDTGSSLVGEGTRFSAKKISDRRKEINRLNNTVDQAVSLVTGKDIKEVKAERIEREQKRKEDAAEIYQSVLSGDFNDVTLQKINDYIDDATPLHPYGQRISQRLPQKLERGLHEGARTNAVDALFSRICESAVPASRRSSEAGRREIEERKKEALKGWAIATNNWHTDLSDFADEEDFIRQGTDSKVYLAKDGKHVIKVSFGKPEGKRFRPDIDTTALFNSVFRNTAYEIVGYGEFDGKFARILKQPFVDFADKTALNADEREEYMRTIGFEPINESRTAFSNGSIVAADLQKSNILKDAAGNISVIDADMKLHTKDVGGNYTYPPVEADLPEGKISFRVVNDKNGKKNLVGLHNISEAKLKKAIKQGGLANPSMAVIDMDKQSHVDYGDITLVAPESLVDKKLGRNVGTYMADAYTPIYPTVTKQMSNKGAKALTKVLETVDETFRNRIRLYFNDYLNSGTMYDALFYWYLSDIGKNPPILEAALPDGYTREEVKNVKAVNPEATIFAELSEEERRKVIDLYIEREGGKEKYENDLANRVEGWKKSIEDENALQMRKKFSQDKLNELEEYGYEYDRIANYYKYAIRLANASSKPSEIETFRNAYDEVVKNGLEEDFGNWLMAKEEELGVEEKLFTGYDNQGRAKYVPNTLENASKLMKKEGRAGATGLGGFNYFVAILAPVAKNTKQISAKKQNLSTQEEYDRFAKKWGDHYHKLALQLQPGADKWADYGYHRLHEIAPMANPKEYAKKEYGIELSDKFIKDLNDVKNAIRNDFPARYFETKFERPVYLNEFAAAVVPEGVSEEIVNALSSAGLPVEYYEKDNNEARMEAVDKVSSEIDGVRFRFIGERGARNLDKAEEATTRLDNLSVAREMEAAEKDAKAIKMATGWERGADGLWRYEVDDNIDFELRRPKKAELKKAYEEANEKYYKLEMRVPTRTPKSATEEEKLRIKEMRKELAKLRKGMNKAFDAYYDYSAESATLVEFLGKDNQLFKEYPELADYEVSFLRDSKKLSEGLKGSFTSEYKVIWIDDARPKGDIKSTFVHEIQHAIQGIEGFAQGGTPAAFASAKYQAEDWKANFNEFINRYGFEDWSKNLPIEDWMKYGKEYKGQFGGLHRAFIDNAVEDEDVKKSLTKELDYVKAAYDKFYQIAGGMDAAYKFKDANEWYRSLSGEVESRNVQQRMGMTDEQRRNTLAESTEDVAREDQIFLKEAMEGQTMFRVLRDPAVDYISQAEDVVEVPRDEVMYTMNNIAPQLYKTSGRFMRQLYKHGTIGRVLKGEYAEIDQIKAKQEYDHAKPILEEYLNELVWMKYQATEAAQEVINDVISDVEYAMQYYKDLSLGKDVWRTNVSPRFRISDYGKQVKAEVDKVTSKYNSKDVMFFDSEMTDEEISSIHPDLTREDVMPLFENNVLGGYSSRMDNISIFANNVPIDNVEDTIFHENVHALLQNGQSIIDAFAENALERFPKNVKRIQERGYDEEEVAEELLVRLVAKAMVYGIFDDVAYNLPESEFENLKVLLKDFGYEYEQEIKSRALAEGRRGTPTLLGGEEIHETRGVRQDTGEQTEEKRTRKEELGKLIDQVADMGLEGVLGNKEYTSAMVDIYKALPNEVRAELADDALRNYGGSIAPAVSDYLNVKAEPSVWDKVVTIVREALRKVGFDLDLNANEVRYMVWRSKKPLDRNSLLEVAEDIDMKNRLKVGEYEGSHTDGEDAYEGDDNVGVRFRVVTDASLIEELESSDKRIGYRNVVLNEDGSFGSPMADKLGKTGGGKKKTSGFELGKWEQAEENPDLVDENGKIDLIKPDGKQVKKVDYNPYIHNRLNCVNRQFKPAWERPDLVYVETEIPVVDLESGYHADKAKKPVGEHKWNGGNLILSRYDKPIRIVGWEEVADDWEEAFKNKGVHFDIVPPALLPILASRGIKILPPHKGMGEECNKAYQKFIDNTPDGGGTRFRVSGKLNVRDEYEATIKKGGYQAREAVQDAMLSLRKFQELIEKASGEKIRDFENAWMHENRLSSVVQAKIHDMERKFYKPMMDAVKKLMKAANLEQEQVADYLMLKHGIERNREMAVRKALTDSEGKIDRTRLDQWYQDKEAIRNDASLDTWRKKQEAMDNVALMYGADMSRDYSGLTSMFDTDDIEECTNKAYDEVEALENAHPVETEALGKAIKAMTQNTLDESFGSGLMDRKVYDELSKDMYDYYIPLRGFDETTSEEVYAYLDQDRGAFNAPLVRAKGRSSKSDNPLAYLKSIAESGLMQGERNKMKQSFLNLVINHPSDLVSVREGVWVVYNPATGEWEAAAPPTIPNDATPADVEAAMEAWEQQMEQAALKDPTLVKKVAEAADVPYRVVGNKMGQHQIIVKRLGKSYTLTINGNPRLAMALNGQTNPNNTSNDGKVAAFVNNKIGSINRSLAAWYTTRNPDFVASNFMRDTFYTNTIVRAKEGNAYANKFHKHYATVLPKMISLFSKYEKGTLNPADPTESAFIDFMMNGGETGYSNLKDVEEIKKQIAKELKGNRFAKVEELAEKLDILNRAVENTARFAAYLTSREVGRSIAKSIYDAKEISVNFNKKGAGGTFFGMTGQTWFGNLAAMVGASGRALYVFFNAAIQGSTNLMHVMKVNPKGTSAGLAAMFLMGAVVPLLFGDDDDEKDYYDLPEHVRRNHLIIPGAGDAWISIPLPIEYRIMYGIGELLTSWRTGHERGTDIARKMLSMTGQALPLNFLEEGLEAFVPSAVSPIYQVMTNSSWTGLPIYKENDFNKDDPEYTKAYSNVDRNLLKFTKALYEWTFDEENQEEGIDLNPAIIETLAKGYFGGLATQLSNLAKVGGMIAGEQEFDWRNIPIGNRILKTGDERTKEKRVNNEYFENMEKLDFLQSRERMLKKTEKGVAVPEADKFNAHKDLETMKGTEVYKKYQEFKKLKKKVDKIRKTMKEKGSTPEREKQLMEAQEAANKVVR